MNVKKTIKGKEISCCLEEITAKLDETRMRRDVMSNRKGNATMNHWLSLDIPGHLYKLEGKGSMTKDGVESKISINKTIEDFHVAKKK